MRAWLGLFMNDDVSDATLCPRPTFSPAFAHPAGTPDWMVLECARKLPLTISAVHVAAAFVIDGLS